MAKSKNSSATKVKTTDYRHTGEKRASIPPAQIESQGQVPKIKRVRYRYNPHLPPVLRFDPTGKADKLPELIAEAGRRPLTESEQRMLADALRNHQPWLEWAGKQEEHERGYFDVDPVALHIHERVSAQAIVRAAMREDVQRDLFADPELPYQQQVQFYRHDMGWVNRLILGDSLQVMASLARRENLAGKVQMIYIDPPYGIGYRSNFQPEILNLAVGEADADVDRQPEQVRAYRDTWRLGLHSYLTYLRDHLVLARELLTPAGSLFLQISEENVHRVRMVLDEVFGTSCGVATIAWKKAAPQTRTIKRGFNYLLWYCRKPDEVLVNKLFRKRGLSDGSTEDAKKLALWLSSSDGYARTLTTEEKREEVDLPQDAVVFRADKVRDTFSADDKVFAFEFDGESLLPGEGFQWRGTPDEMHRLRESERLVRTAETLAYRFYLTDSGGVEISTLWEDTAGKIPDMRYAVQTPEKIIARCILLTTHPGDLVLDPTSGSGTTPYVTELWGRLWIGIDTGRVAIAIARQRLLVSRYEPYATRDVYQSACHQNPGAGLKYATSPTR